MTKLSEVNAPGYRDIIQTLHAVYCTLMGLPAQESIDPQKLAIALQMDCGMTNRNARLRVLDMITRGHTIPPTIPLRSTNDLSPKQVWAFYTIVKSMNNARLKQAYIVAEASWLEKGEITKKDALTPEERKLVLAVNAMKSNRRNLVAKMILNGHPF